MFDLFNQPAQIVHTRENNPESEANLRKHAVKFNRQCEAVFTSLMLGHELTTHSALMGLRLGHGTICIGHLPRRIADLREKGVAISTRKTDGGYNVWFMSEADKLKNKGLI